MHEKIVEDNQEMESSLTPNDKGVHNDKFCKKELNSTYKSCTQMQTVYQIKLMN